MPRYDTSGGNMVYGSKTTVETLDNGPNERQNY